MKYYSFTISIVLSFFMAMASLDAQEEQVAFVPGVFELSSNMRKNADVLEAYENDFDRAQLFVEDGQYFLRIFFNKKKESWSDDVPLSVDELNGIREAIATMKNEDTNHEENDRNGRYYLVTSASLHSVPQSVILANMTRREVTIDPDWGDPYSYYEKSNFGIALPFFATAGAITSSILLTRNSHISPAAANMHFFGSIFGYGHGLLLASLVKGDDLFFGADERYITESLLIAGSSIAEGWIGYYLAKKRKFTYAQSMAYNTGNFWGGYTGLLGYSLTTSSFEPDPVGFGFLGLAGSVGGLWLFDALHKRHPRSSGDLRAINTAGFIGANLGLAFVFESNSNRAVSAAALLGAGAGIVGSYMSTASTQFTKLEGGLLFLSSVGGFALGAGVGILGDFEGQGTAFSTAIGSSIGWIASYLYFRNNESTRRRSTSSDLGNNMQFNLNPAGLTMLMSSPEQQMNMMRQNMQMNLLNLNYRF